MGILDIVALVLGIAETALGSAGVDNKNVARWLKTAKFLLAQGEQARDDLLALATQMQVMVDEDRDPTDDEWESLKSRSDMAFAAISNWQDPDE